MSRIDEITGQLQYVASHPKEAIEQHKKETGKGAVGIIYVYGPEEIIHAAGSLPVGLWGAPAHFEGACLSALLRPAPSCRL